MGRDPMKDLSQMGEAVDLLGDSPPTPEEIDASTGTPAPAEPVAEPSAGEEPVGAPASSGVDDQDQQQIFEELTGVPAKPEPVGTPEAPPAEGSKEPEPPTVESPSRTDERIKALTDRANKAEAREAKLMELALAGKTPVTEGEGTAGQEPIELESEVEEYFNPYIDKKNAVLEDRLKVLEAELEPIRRKSGDEEMAAVIAKSVPGFQVGMLDTLQAEVESMPEAEQGLYKGHISGAVLLAKEMASNGKLQLGNKTGKKPSRLAETHNSDLGGEAPGVGSSLSAEEMAKRVDDMSAEDVFAILEKARNS